MNTPDRPQTVQLNVIPPHTIEEWHRRDKVEAMFEATGIILVRLAWWATIFFAGYLAALIVTAKGA